MCVSSKGTTLKKKKKIKLPKGVPYAPCTTT